MITSVDNALNSAKAIANMIPVAIDDGMDIADINNAAYGVAHLIEIAMRQLEDEAAEARKSSAKKTTAANGRSLNR